MQARENLSEVLEKAVRNKSLKVLEKAEVIEFTLGTVPPVVKCEAHSPRALSPSSPQHRTSNLRQSRAGLCGRSPAFPPKRRSLPILRLLPPRFCTSRYDAENNYLQLEFDLAFDTVGFQGLVEATVRLFPRAPAIRVPVAMRNLRIAGRLLVGFSLVSKSPGVDKVETSFATQPEFDVSVSTVGIPITDFPMIEQFAIGKLQHILATRFVEPARSDADMVRIFCKRTLTKTLGPGGLLVVVVCSARSLRGKDGGGGAAGSSLSPYVALRFNGFHRRTHVLIDSVDPQWNAVFTFPVPATQCNCLQADVVDWAATGDPEVMGTSEVSVDTRSDRVRVDEDLKTATLKLVGGGGGAETLVGSLV